MAKQIATMIADTLAALEIEALISDTLARAEMSALVTECADTFAERAYMGPLLMAA